MSDLLERVAGAPITWGVDGSPGWGYLMGRDRVLREMVESGLSATELGPDGYLPTDPTELQDYLAPFGLSIVGGFVPALLYRPDRIEAQLEYVTRAARQLASTGSKVLVLGPSSHHPGYDTSVDMDAGEWTTFLANLKRLEGVVNDAGLTTALHPHWGMAIETGAAHRPAARVVVRRAVSRHGPRLPGGHRPGRRRAGGARSRPPCASQGRRPGQGRPGPSGEVPFRESVIDGLFVPLGQGAVDIAGVIAVLEDDGYRGWYVLEQDVSLKGEPPVGEGPKADAVDSVAYLRSLVGALREPAGIARPRGDMRPPGRGAAR